MKCQLVLAMSLVGLINAETLITGTPMKCADIKNMIDYHDMRRSQVALGRTKLPKAKNMFALKWSDSLAKVAQDYANKCVFEHNKNRPKLTGENLAIHGKKEEMFADIMKMNDMWFNEIAMYEYDREVNDLKSTGHFTQLIWAETKFVGCGASLFKDNTDFPYKTLVVCDYQPPGNWRGRKPYESADNNATCDNGMYYHKYGGLCAQDKEHQEGRYDPCAGSSSEQFFRPYTCVWFAILYFLGIFK